MVNFTEEDPFDPKAVWLNAEHIRTMPAAELAEKLLPVVAKAGFHVDAKNAQITPLIQERIRLLQRCAHRRRFLLRRRTRAL